MKIFIIIIIIIALLIVVFQIYITISTNKSETQTYNLIRKEDDFEIRQYPSTMTAKVTSTTKSYQDLGYSGFRKLANYIFGGNEDKMKIAMTSPVHMEIGDSLSSMSFIMPSTFSREDLPRPDNQDIIIEMSKPEIVAVLEFGGFANTENINKYRSILEKLLIDKGISYYGNFKLLGYNPPFQLFGRRNEVIVALNPQTFD
jgi:hypothetical protein